MGSAGPVQWATWSLPWARSHRPARAAASTKPEPATKWTEGCTGWSNSEQGREAQCPTQGSGSGWQRKTHRAKTQRKTFECDLYTLCFCVKAAPSPSSRLQATCRSCSCSALTACWRTESCTDWTEERPYCPRRAFDQPWSEERRPTSATRRSCSRSARPVKCRSRPESAKRNPGRDCCRSSGHGKARSWKKRCTTGCTADERKSSATYRRDAR